MNYTTYPQQQQQFNRPMQYPINNWSVVQPNPQVRPVSSVEEVRAYPIDFDGSIFYFPDIANKKIYTKSINLDGTVSINVYELKTVADQSTISSYVTRQEFDDALNQMKLMYEELLKAKNNNENIQTAAQQTTFTF